MNTSLFSVSVILLQFCYVHSFYILGSTHKCFPNGSVGKESTCNARDSGDPDSIPGLGRSSGEGSDNPLQYSRLENPMDRGAWQITSSPWGHNETQLSD